MSLSAFEILGCRTSAGRYVEKKATDGKPAMGVFGDFPQRAALGRRKEKGEGRATLPL
jgi:hypothetical protein